MPATDRILELPNMQLAARVWGDPSLPPLLALHGWLDNAASFDALAPLLCTQFHIVALDLPGHGRSQHRPPGSWYHFVDYLDDVLAAVEALGWSRFHLLGHSLGAGIATVLAGACPERIESLQLIELIAPHTMADDQALVQLQRALRQRRELQGKPLRVFASIDAAAEVRAKAGGISLPVARTLVARGLRCVPGGYSWSSDPRLMPAVPLRYSEDQILPILQGIRAPTLFVLAEPMALPIPEEILLARAQQVANLQLVRLPGNHHLHMEDAAPVAAAILAFNAKHEQSVSV